MPIAITRPSIIGAAWREPIGGWIDTISAAGVIFVSVGVGLLKMIQGMPFCLLSFMHMQKYTMKCVYKKNVSNGHGSLPPLPLIIRYSFIPCKSAFDNHMMRLVKTHVRYRAVYYRVSEQHQTLLFIRNQMTPFCTHTYAHTNTVNYMS